MNTSTIIKQLFALANLQYRVVRTRLASITPRMFRAIEIGVTGSVAVAVLATLAFPQLSYAAPLEMNQRHGALKVPIENYKKASDALELMTKNRSELSPTLAQVRAQEAQKQAQQEAEKLAQAQAAAAQQQAATKITSASVGKTPAAAASNKTTQTKVRAPEPHVQTPQLTGGRILNVTITAYNSEVGQTDSSPWTTASGTRVHDGTLALNCLPFGTKVKIPKYFGDKIFTIEDRTAKRYGCQSRADIWMLSKKAALQWGIKRNVQLVVMK